jgi:putative DNA primase/helicase
LLWCEGEKDCEAARAHGLTAVSFTNGAKAAAKVIRELPVELLTGKRHTLLFDADKAGRDGAAAAADALLNQGAAEVRIASWPEGTAEGGDVSDWFAGGGTAEVLQAILDQAATVTPKAAKAASARSRGFTEEAARHLDLALEFAETYRAEWMPTEGRQWYRYTDGVWVQRDGDEARQLLWPFVDERTDKGATSALVSSIHDAAVTLKGWRKPAEELNPDPMLINCRNLVYDLRTGETRPHNPDLLQTVQRPFKYHKGASCTRWVEFLADVLVDEQDQPDSELIKVVQEWFGYCLVPETRAQKAMVWTGEGSNGKGVATGILTSLVGEQNTVATEIAKLDHEYNRAALRDKLLAISAEVPTGSLVADSTFKMVVSGDPLPARLPHGKPFTFRPYSRILITCNGMPVTKDQTYAYYRRLIILPWNRKVEEAEVIGDLEDRLRRTELPGIFEWSVEGLRRLIANDWHFTQASAADRAKEQYRLEGDSVAMWVHERTIVNQEAPPELTSALFDDYGEYCERYKFHPVAVTTFGKRLKSTLGSSVRSDDSVRGKKGWRGIQLLPTDPTWSPRGGGRRRDWDS